MARLSSETGISRRTALRWVLSSSGLALLAACAPVSPQAAPTPSAPAPTSASAAANVLTAQPSAPQQPKTGGTIHYAGLDDITSVDAHRSSSPAFDTMYQIFDRLTEYDLKLQPQPRLAETWDFNADQTQLKVNLRKGVQFHSGRELTSDDVKWNLTRVRDPKISNGSVPAQANWFSAIDTPDKYTVILKSDQPRPGTFDFFEYVCIMEPVADGVAVTRPVGTGPFTFVEWNQGDHFSAVKNANYWQSGRPYVDGFVMSVFHDASSMITGLEAGSQDIVKDPPVQDFARLKDDPKYQLLLEPEGRFFYLGPNTLVKPFDDKRVRQALAYTLDRKRFVDAVSLGFGTAQSCPWPSFSPAYEASKANAYSYDLDKAKSLLNQAGVSNLTLEIWPVSLYPQLQEFAQIQQAALASIGITATIKQTDLASWVSTVIGHTYQGIYSTAFGTAQLFPATLLTGSAYNPAGNNEAFQSDQYTQLVNNLGTETDATKRAQLYSQINDLLIDEAFVWPIATAPFRIGAAARLQGLEFLLHDAVSFTNAWFTT
jgi:peptide/nickel transport system substrate-binding protein